MKNKKTSKNKHDTSICPDGFKLIFKAVNELPQDLKKFEDDLIELYGQQREEWHRAIQKHGNKLIFGYEPLENDWLKLQSIYTPKLRRMISAKLAQLINMEDGARGFETAIQRLRLVVNEKITLLNIIHSFQRWHYDQESQSTYKRIFEFEKAVNKFYFNEDTSIELLSSEALEILQKEKVPIKRIKTCLACKNRNIFWAKRSDSKTCSSKCLNTLNKRKSETKKRIDALKKGFDIEFEEFEKRKARLGFNHLLVSEQMKKLDKLQNKLDTENLKYGTL